MQFRARLAQDKLSVFPLKSKHEGFVTKLPATPLTFKLLRGLFFGFRPQERYAEPMKVEVGTEEKSTENFVLASVRRCVFVFWKFLIRLNFNFQSDPNTP